MRYHKIDLDCVTLAIPVFGSLVVAPVSHITLTPSRTCSSAALRRFLALIRDTVVPVTHILLYVNTSHLRSFVSCVSYTLYPQVRSKYCVALYRVCLHALSSGEIKVLRSFVSCVSYTLYPRVRSKYCVALYRVCLTLYPRLGEIKVLRSFVSCLSYTPYPRVRSKYCVALYRVCLTRSILGGCCRAIALLCCHYYANVIVASLCRAIISPALIISLAALSLYPVLSGNIRSNHRFLQRPTGIHRSVPTEWGAQHLPHTHGN
ncbi:hypothetical protein J6590_036137 [Homalodisca vitripennis]|nr:hypothetical protein J6590_036137 [Homalodisca vitripennis]